jgi:hypothetical protein
MMTLILLLAALQSAGEVNLQIREGHERRGAVLARADGLAAESAMACAAACALYEGCRAWTWRSGDPFRPARCDFQAHVTTSTPLPGAVTGLSPAFTATIDAAMDRPLSALERQAASATTGRPALRGSRPVRNGELAGG